MSMSIYHMINWFFVFSLLGYLLECVVLTYENKTPVINRGFGHGPFCIIYGFGALGAVALLTPLAAAALLVFCLLYTPCVAAITSIKRELGGKWAALVVVMQCAIAWLCAFAVYTIGGLL